MRLMGSLQTRPIVGRIYYERSGSMASGAGRISIQKDIRERPAFTYPASGLRLESQCGLNG